MLRHRQKKARDKLWFNDEVLTLLASQMNEDAELLEFQRDALDECIEKLPAEDQLVLELRFQKGSTWEAMSEKLSTSTRSAQRTMAKVRRMLHRCITAKLREWHVN